MHKSLKKLLKPFVPKAYFSFLNWRKDRRLLSEWINNGRPLPPPQIVKKITIKEYQQRYGFATLVETGTYMGDMVQAQKRRFRKIISIELGLDLFEKARERFRRDKNVTILQGDSGKVLPMVVKELNEPALFWLDGHYSAGITAKGEKDCPIFEELEAIFSDDNHNHLLLIDDARYFNGKGDYPTIEKLTEFIKSKNSQYRIEVKDDIIRCTVS